MTNKQIVSFAKARNVTHRKNEYMIILYHPKQQHTAYYYASEQDCNADINNLLDNNKLSNYECGINNVLHAAMTNIHVVKRYNNKIKSN
jgi:hypothetical protein